MPIQKSPDNFLETWVGIAAIWGAITGTIALVIQLIQHLADRPKLALDAKMLIKSDVGIIIELKAVNNGRRPMKVELVGFELPKSELSRHLPSEIASSDSSYELILFDAKRFGQFIELTGEGGKYVFSEKIPKEIAVKMFQEQEIGKTFLQLTSGKKFFADFDLLDPEYISRFLRT